MEALVRLSFYCFAAASISLRRCGRLLHPVRGRQDPPAPRGAGDRRGFIRCRAIGTA